MSTLAQLRTRVLQLLLDTGSAIYPSDLVDESLRQALHDYSQVRPLQMETVVTLPGDGREIALNGISELLEVTNVWWPYDSAATSETWPPNQVRGWHVYWDDAQAVLFLDQLEGAQPQMDDEVRVWYTTIQKVEGMDSAAATTVRIDHETGLCLGAAGYAALSRVVDLVETAGTDLYAMALQATWGNAKLREFRRWLETLRAREVRSGTPAWGYGWSLDKWDNRSASYPGADGGIGE